MSQRPPVADSSVDLDEVMSEVTRGTVQKAVLGATLLADHRRRQTDRHTGDLSKAASEERQRAAMDVLRARTGYAHAADARWVARAGETELAAAWVNAEPWCESDEVAARVHHLIGERLERDWPSLAGEYARGVNDGLDPAEAMRRASRETLADFSPGTADNHALLQAGIVQEQHARRRLSTPDDETTPDVDEHHEAVGLFVQETERGRALQARAAAAANEINRSQFAPARTPVVAAPSMEARTRSRG